VITLGNPDANMRNNSPCIEAELIKDEDSPFDRWNEIEANEQGQCECESNGIDVEQRSFSRIG
jgi:hypothetical protein